MFGGPGLDQPPPSKEEIKAAEIQTSATVKTAAITCLVLYLAPFAIDAVRKLV
ncbi:hypothetical protein TWF696_009355 [Orbilia brochopaga]|uniref:Mitochondrial outer membrane translocase complex, subunit Tom5 n=1 Tax=Orbilia brochopaga TaxID=3140254 RepID=A0AAV9UEY2_9PEZI